MDVNDNAGSLTPSGVLESIASRLAPTKRPVPFTKFRVHLLSPCTKELAISSLRAIVARAAATKNLHQTGKISGHNKNPQRKPS